MPHPVRDNQTTTTSPHQPSPPHPTPAGDPPGRPTSPPSRLPTPRWQPSVGAAGAQAGQARSRRSPGGAPVRPRQHTTRACHLPPPTARLQAAGPGAFRCSRLLVCPAPPPLAALRAADWGRAGCRWVGLAEQTSGPPCSRSCGPRSTCAWPGWCLWATHSRSCFSASLPAVPSPLCTGSAPSVGLAGALVRSGVAELGRGHAGWGGEALARSCAAKCGGQTCGLHLGGVGAVPPCAKAGASGSGAERHAGAGRGAGRPCVRNLAPQAPPFNLIQSFFE